jgi:hypothetical protein
VAGRRDYRWDDGQALDRRWRDQFRLVEYFSRPIHTSTISWLWKPFLARGTIALLDGDPGVGKSLLAIDLMSRVCGKRPMPDGQTHDYPVDDETYSNGLLVNNEDPHQAVIVPRFLAAGCPEGAVGLFGGYADVPPLSGCEPIVPTQFPRDFGAFANLVRQRMPALVVVDPIAACVSTAFSTGHDQLFREALTPFAALALEVNACVLFVRHLAKNPTARGLYRGAGTIGIAGAARTVLLAGPHPTVPGQYVLTLAKGNYAGAGASYAYRVTTKTMYAPHPHGPPAPFAVPVIDWQGPSDATADDVTAARPARTPTPTSLDRATKWLQDQLAAGPKPRNDLTAAALNDGLSLRTLRRAKRMLGVRSRRVVEGEKTWYVWEAKGETGSA